MIYTHTLVRNGQPYIGLILRQVIPFAEKCFVTISEKSTDGTLRVIEQLREEFPGKIVLRSENVEKAADLTSVRQYQIDRTPKGKWILFLDDDDYWPEDSLETLAELMRIQDIDGFAFNPYQVIDRDSYDDSWRNRWFTKFFKNQEGVHYKHPWPKDLIYKNEEELYWRKNSRVMRANKKYFHLSHIKPSSFRKEPGFEKYDKSIGKPFSFPIEAGKHLERIFSWK